MSDEKKLSEVVAAFDDALKRLNKAKTAYETAHAAERAASRETTTALNSLNAVQKEMDKLDADLRAAMPRESDWRRRTEKHHAVVERQNG